MQIHYANTSEFLDKHQGLKIYYKNQYKWFIYLKNKYTYQNVCDKCLYVYSMNDNCILQESHFKLHSTQFELINIYLLLTCLSNTRMNNKHTNEQFDKHPMYLYDKHNCSRHIIGQAIDC